MDLIKSLSCAYGFESCLLVNKKERYGEPILWSIKNSEGQKFFLKEKDRYTIKEDFEFHLQVHDYVQSKDNIVVNIIRTVDDILWFSWEGRLFELHEWFEGKVINWNSIENVERIGNIIARFLHACRGFDKRIGDWLFPSNRSEFFPETCSEILAFTKHIDKAVETLSHKSSSSALWVKSWIKKQADMLENKCLPQQLIHADAYGDNCLIALENTRNSVIVDLNSVHWGYRLSDVAMAAAVIGSMTWKNHSSHNYEFNKELDFERIKFFKKSFEKISPLSSVENDCFNSALGLNLIRAFVSCLYLDDLEKPSEDILQNIENLVGMLKTLK